MLNEDDESPMALHDSIKPAGLVRRGVVKFVWFQFSGWAVRASVASRNGGLLSASEAETAAHRAKLDSDKLGDEAARPNRWLD